MKIIEKLTSLKTAITSINRMDDDLGFALKELDQLTGEVCKIEEDLKVLPTLLQQLAENHTFLITKIEELESALIANEVLKKDYRKKVMN